MPREKIIRTIRQHSKPLPEETMAFLRGIAADCATVKNCVYRRYSGIGSIEKLYPGYTVQNEMNATSLRKDLNLPYTYYGLAMFDALRGSKIPYPQNEAINLLKKARGTFVMPEESD